MRIWSSRGASLATLNAAAGAVGSVAFANDGQRALAGTANGGVWLWREIGALVLRGHAGAIWQVAYAPTDSAS